jgi:hypothetical protein
MHYPDLSPCTDFPFDADGKLIAVGWLSPGMDYDRLGPGGIGATTR